MTYETFRYQDDSQDYLMERINQYVMEKYNPIVAKEQFHKMFIIGDIGFSFSIYSVNAMQSFVSFTANRVHYIKEDDAYYLDYQVNAIEREFDCGDFAGWDDVFYKEVFVFVDKMLARTNELAPKSYSYFRSPVYKVVKGK